LIKAAAFHFDTSVKTSSPLLNCCVNHLLVKSVPCRHNALNSRSSYKVKVTQWKSFFGQTVFAIIRTTNS